MNLQSREHDFYSKKETEREGLVVWDQKGLVVLWPDGHCGRFPWTALRQACLCAECRNCCEEQAADMKSFSMKTPTSREEPGPQLH